MIKKDLKVYPILICTFTLIQNLFLISCSQHPLEWSDSSILFQIPGCYKKINNPLLKESCFNYDFKQDLIIDFCASANCCPDKDRFKLTSAVLRDTITIAVKDTAKNLCKCICNYIIHAEIKNPPGEIFIVKCVTVDENSKNILYIEKVSKK